MMPMPSGANMLHCYLYESVVESMSRAKSLATAKDEFTETVFNRTYDVISPMPSSKVGPASTMNLHVADSISRSMAAG